MNLIPLCIARLSVDPPFQFGTTPTGQRSMSDIREAVFEGDRLNAVKIGSSAADWLILARDVGSIDVRMALRTDDGVLIGLRYWGKLDVADRANRTSRVAATFDTGDPRYAWLARMQVVGKSRLERDGVHWTVHYDFWELA
jgi:hypothetical protein